MNRTWMRVLITTLLLAFILIDSCESGRAKKPPRQGKGGRNKGETPKLKPHSKEWCLEKKAGCDNKTCNKCCNQWKTARCLAVLADEPGMHRGFTKSWCDYEWNLCEKVKAKVMANCDECCERAALPQCAKHLEETPKGKPGVSGKNVGMGGGMKDLKKWCAAEEQKCKLEECEQCCTRSTSDKCKDALAGRSGNIGSTRQMCRTQQRKCNNGGCAKCCDLVKTPACVEALKKKPKRNTPEWCEDQKDRCGGKTKKCPSCCQNIEKKYCRKHFGASPLPTKGPGKRAGRRKCIKAKRGCMFKNKRKYCETEDCCAEAKEPRCVRILQHYCSVGGKTCNEITGEGCRNKTRICFDRLKPFCEKQKKLCEETGCKSCCKKVSQERCIAALNDLDPKEEQEPTREWCNHQRARCMSGKCDRCCEAADKYKCPALSGDQVETVEDIKTIPGKPESRVTESIGDINENVRGIQAMEKIAEPLTIGNGSSKITIKLHTVEELKRSVEKKNNIKAALVSSLGLTVPENATDDDSIFFASDMMLSDTQADEILNNLKKAKSPISARRKRKIQEDVTTRWEGTIPYVFDAYALNDPNLIEVVHKAMDFWEQNSCIKFKNVNPDEAEQTDGYIIIVRSRPGCASYKGKIGGPQEVYLGFGCENFGVVTHEIGHALGLWHEHQRPDRDEYVQIVENEVELKKIDNFYMCENNTECLSTVPFDYGSVMHYHAFAFSRTGAETLLSKDPSMQQTMGARRLGPSFYDVKQVNDAYQCQAKCGFKVECQNGGIPNFYENCYRCICPAGFTGYDCTTVKQGNPAECGGTLFAFDEWQEIESPQYPNPYPLQQECNWVLQAMPGWNVEFEFQPDSEFDILESIPCEYNFVEVRSGTDLKNTGPRYCGKSPPPAPILSETNRLIVILKATDDVDTFTGFKGRFRRTGGVVPTPDPMAEITDGGDGGDYEYPDYYEYEGLETTLDPNEEFGSTTLSSTDEPTTTTPEPTTTTEEPTTSTTPEPTTSTPEPTTTTEESTTSSTTEAVTTTEEPTTTTQEITTTTEEELTPPPTIPTPSTTTTTTPPPTTPKPTTTSTSTSTTSTSTTSTSTTSTSTSTSTTSTTTSSTTSTTSTTSTSTSTSTTSTSTSTTSTSTTTTPTTTSTSTSTTTTPLPTTSTTSTTTSTTPDPTTTTSATTSTTSTTSTSTTSTSTSTSTTATTTPTTTSSTTSTTTSTTSTTTSTTTTTTSTTTTEEPTTTTTEKPTTTTTEPPTTTTLATTTQGLGLFTDPPTTPKPTTTTTESTTRAATLHPRCTSRSWRRLINNECESPSNLCLQIRKTSRNYRRCTKCGKCQPQEPGQCPEGFDPSDSPFLCFKRAAKKSGTWEEAKEECLSEGGFLPSFIDRPESNVFASYARSISVPYTWVGLRDRDGDKSFKGETWDDGTSYVDYTRSRLIRTVWDPMRRRRKDGCALINTRRRRLNFASCKYKYPIICQVRVSAP